LFLSLDLDFSVPGILSLLNDRKHRSAHFRLGLACGIQIHGELVFPNSIYVLAYRWHKSRYIAWTAGRSVPTRPAAIAIGLEWVHVKETVAGQGNACKHRVIQRTFHDVCMLDVYHQQIHPMMPEHHAYRGEGFAIGGLLRYIKILEKALVCMGSAEGAGDVHMAQHHIVPYAVKGGHVIGIGRSGYD